MPGTLSGHESQGARMTLPARLSGQEDGSPRSMLSRPSFGSDLSTDLLEQMMKDDHMRTDIVRTLVNVEELQSAWNAMTSRLNSCAKTTQEVKAYANRTALEEDFVLKQEYEKTVVRGHGERLDSLRKKVAVLQEDSDAEKIARIQTDNEVTAIKQRLHCLEELMSSTCVEIDEDRQQATQRHELLLGTCGDLNARHDVLRESVAGRLEKLSASLRMEESARAEVDARVTDLAVAFDGQRFTDRLQAASRVILEDYIPWTGMSAKVQEVTAILLDPIHAELRRLETEHLELDRVLAAKHESVQGELKGVNSKVAKHQEAHADLWNAITERETLKNGDEREKRIISYFTPVKTEAERLVGVSSKKMVEIVERMTELQEIVENHEHTLLHQAEEIMNRATKYDLVVNEQRIDKCALKEKVDHDLSDMQNLMRWVTVKMEDVTSAQHFDSSSRANSVAARRSVGSHTNSRMDDASDGMEDDDDTLSQYSQATAVGRKPKSKGGTDAVAVQGTEKSKDTSSQLDSRHLLVASKTPSLGSECDEEEIAVEPQVEPTTAAPAPAATVTATAPAAAEGKRANAETAGATVSWLLDAQEKLDTQRSRKVQSSGDNTSETESRHGLHTQLACLAECVICMASAVFHLHTRVSDRNQQKRTQADVVHHLSNVVGWIVNGSTSSEWDKSRLTTLALQCMRSFQVSSAFDYRRCATDSALKAHRQSLHEPAAVRPLPSRPPGVPKHIKTVSLKSVDKLIDSDDESTPAAQPPATSTSKPIPNTTVSMTETTLTDDEPASPFSLIEAEPQGSSSVDVDGFLPERSQGYSSRAGACSPVTDEGSTCHHPSVTPTPQTKAHESFQRVGRVRAAAESFMAAGRARAAAGRPKSQQSMANTGESGLMLQGMGAANQVPTPALASSGPHGFSPPLSARFTGGSQPSSRAGVRNGDARVGKPVTLPNVRTP